MVLGTLSSTSRWAISYRVGKLGWFVHFVFAQLGNVKKEANKGNLSQTSEWYIWYIYSLLEECRPYVRVSKVMVSMESVIIFQYCEEYFPGEPPEFFFDRFEMVWSDFASSPHIFIYLGTQNASQLYWTCTAGKASPVKTLEGPSNVNILKKNLSKVSNIFSLYK